MIVRVATAGRKVRIPDEVWTAAKARAESQGTTASAVVNAALVLYLAGRLDHLLAPDRHSGQSTGARASG
jgi:hypothetical protein